MNEEEVICGGLPLNRPLPALILIKVIRKKRAHKSHITTFRNRLCARAPHEEGTAQVLKNL